MILIKQLTMPYFIYYVTTNPATNSKSLEFIDQQADYKAARSLAREKRAELGSGNPNQECRMIFAKNDVEAEKLLSAPR